MVTINHECYVSLEVAELLKEAGFVWETEFGQHILDRDIRLEHNINFNSEKYLVSLPTLEVAQRWLREVKGIEIDILCVYINNAKKYSYCVFEGKYNNEHIEEGFDTFEEAQEAGIKKALELILEKGGQHDS